MTVGSACLKSVEVFTAPIDYTVFIKAAAKVVTFFVTGSVGVPRCFVNNKCVVIKGFHFSVFVSHSLQLGKIIVSVAVASQRFALQRKLAELPQFPVTQETAKKLEDAVDRIAASGKVNMAETTLGPVIKTNKGPVKMQLIIGNDTFPSLRPADLAEIRAKDIGQMVPTGLVDALQDTRQLVDVNFNMINPDGVPIFRYDPIQDPIARKQIRAMGGYRAPMMEALYKLIGEMKMQPGDILKAAPIGLSAGDTRRATTYMGAGFGIPDRLSGQMYAQIGRDGTLQPVQLLSPNNQIANRIGAIQDMSRLLQPRQLELDFERAALRERMAERDAAADRFFEQEFGGVPTNGVRYESFAEADANDRTITSLDELYVPGSAARERINAPGTRFHGEEMPF